MAFCSSCGAEVQGRFCAKCGASAPAAASSAGGQTPPASNPNPGGYTPPPPPPQAQASTAGAAESGGLTDNVAGALCYLLGILTGILFLVIAPHNQSKFVRFHAFQSIFFGVAIFVLWIVITIISFVLPAIPFVGIVITMLLGFGMWIGMLICWILLMYKAYNNEKFKLPIIGDLAEKQA